MAKVQNRYILFGEVTLLNSKFRSCLVKLKHCTEIYSIVFEWYSLDTKDDVLQRRGEVWCGNGKVQYREEGNCIVSHDSDAIEMQYTEANCSGRER